MAVELRNRVERRLGVALSLSGLLQGATLEQLLAEVEDGLEERPETAAADEGAVLAAPRPEIPLSSGQRGLWFLHRLAPQSTAYHLVIAARLRGAGEEDGKRLAAALQALVDRHDALRASFPALAGEPVQRIAPRHELPLTEIVTDAPLAEAVDAVASPPFDLAAGPLVRAALIRRPSEAVLVLAAHHLVADFTSLQVLAAELDTLLRGGSPPPVGGQIGDFVARQEAWLAGPESERSWQFWRASLTGEPPLLDLPRTIPGRRSRPGAVAPSPGRSARRSRRGSPSPGAEPRSIPRCWPGSPSGSPP